MWRLPQRSRRPRTFPQSGPVTDDLGAAADWFFVPWLLTYTPRGASVPTTRLYAVLTSSGTAWVSSFRLRGVIARKAISQFSGIGFPTFGRNACGASGELWKWSPPAT